MNGKISNWFQHTPNGSRVSRTLRSELGYYGRIKSQKKFKKTRNECNGQILQRGHGKIPICKVKFLTLEYRINRLRKQLGYS